MDILKRPFRLPLLVIILVTLSVILFSSTGILKRKLISQKQTINKTSFGLPVRLIIPTLNINADIQELGVISTGEMAVPTNIIDVGWFKFGSKPGENGSAVIAGHFNGQNNQQGVFANLDKLKAGDKVSVVNNQGSSITFLVREKRIYDSGFADDVFNQSDSAHLNLITCDGIWDDVKKSYSQRLVVFTDILN